MTIYIKNMVCKCCVVVVRQEFEKLGLKPKVGLGEVSLSRNLLKAEQVTISQRLKKLGLVLLIDEKEQLVQKIKSLLVKKIESEKVEAHFGLANYLSSKLAKEYSQITRLFSAMEGMTIEQFFIARKIEKAKVLLHQEIPLGEIAQKLGYSNISHLSAQFKKVTGFTPSAFKKES